MSAPNPKTKSENREEKRKGASRGVVGLECCVTKSVLRGTHTILTLDAMPMERDARTSNDAD